MQEYTDLELETEGSYGIESRETSLLGNIFKGPFILHNFLVTNATQLKSDNALEDPRFFKIFPFGGSRDIFGDVVALCVWLLIIVYAFATIPMGCFCPHNVNIANTITLAVITTCTIIMGFIMSKNVKKMKRMWCVIKVPQNRCLGAQNRFVQMEPSEVQSSQYLNGAQKTKIRRFMSSAEKNNVTVMLCSGSYWRFRVVYPAICLISVSLVCMISIIVQLEFISMSRMH